MRSTGKGVSFGLCSFLFVNAPFKVGLSMPGQWVKEMESSGGGASDKREGAILV